MSLAFTRPLSLLSVHNILNPPPSVASDRRYIKTVLYGQASFYAAKFHGRRTASGQIFNHDKYTAACNALPLGTLILVTNLRNGKKVRMRINDRLDKKTKRLIDLTRSGAKKLGFIKAGLTRVKVEVLDEASNK